MVAQHQQTNTQGPVVNAGGGGAPKHYWKKNKDGLALVEVPKEAHENPPANGYFRLRLTGITNTFNMTSTEYGESVNVRCEYAVIDPGKANHGRKFSEMLAVQRKDTDSGDWYNAITPNSKFGQILVAIGGPLQSTLTLTEYLNGEFMASVTQKVKDDQYGRRTYASTTYKTINPVETEPAAAASPPPPVPVSSANPYMDDDL